MTDSLSLAVGAALYQLMDTKLLSLECYFKKLWRATYLYHYDWEISAAYVVVRHSKSTTDGYVMLFVTFSF